MTNRRKVVLTGASGYIASLLLPAFRQRYDLVLLDVRTTDREGKPVEGIQQGLEPRRTAFQLAQGVAGRLQRGQLVRPRKPSCNARSDVVQDVLLQARKILPSRRPRFQAAAWKKSYGLRSRLRIGASGLDMVCSLLARARRSTSRA